MNINMDCPELDTEQCQDGFDLIDYIDGLTAEISDLKYRLLHIKAISIMSRRGLVDTIECICCSEGGFKDALMVIERIAGNK